MEEPHGDKFCWKNHRRDQILPPAQYAQKFIDDSATARLEWVEDCGNVPHLEQPILTADTIGKVDETKKTGKNSSMTLQQNV